MRIGLFHLPVIHQLIPPVVHLGQLTYLFELQPLVHGQIAEGIIHQFVAQFVRQLRAHGGVSTAALS